MEQREAGARVYAALDQLSERDRTLMILFELEQLTGEAIAELVGVRIDTLWVQLHRARARFLAKLGPALDGTGSKISHQKVGP